MFLRSANFASDEVEEERVKWVDVLNNYREEDDY